MLIFGFGPRSAQDLGEVAELTCPSCHSFVAVRHWQTRKAFSLFFVPVIPYGREDVVACPVCAYGVRVRPNDIEHVTGMQSVTRQFRQGRVPAEEYRAHVAQFCAAVGFEGYDPRASGATHPGWHLPEPPPAPPNDRVPDAEAWPQQGPASAPAAPPGRTKADHLAELARLRAEGVLSEAEYDAARARVLRRE